MVRFFLPPSEWAAPAWELRGDEAHHAARVLRLKQGDSCIVFDGCGRAAHAVVAEPPRSSGVLLVPGEECLPSPPVAHLTLCQAVPKGANMDLIIQKSVELGVSAIVPLVTDRTIVRLNAREAEAKRQKWQRIALE
ncbi:RsmE family RNA methyltransferase, partial [Akkermansia muciniphila]